VAGVSDRLRVGIIGANMGSPRVSWGVRAHLPALKALPDVEVVAVCTTHMATAEETARHFGVALAFDDPAEMVRCDRVDVVDVCVNVMHHPALVGLAIDAGKHVFCEWPLAATPDESRALATRAQAGGVAHVVGLQARFAPVYDYMRSLVAGGFVGDVLACSVNGSMTMAPSPRTEVLSLIHFGHCVDTLLHVVGDELDTLNSLVAIEPVANRVLVQGRLRSGAFVDVNIRHVPVFTTGFTFEVNGTEGTLVASIDGSELAARDVRSLGEQINQAALLGGRIGEAVAPMPVPARHRWVPPDVPTGPPLSVAQLWQRFAEGIRDGTAPDAVPDFGVAWRRHELFASVQA
jgi:predicted dehydrogenase